MTTPKPLNTIDGLIEAGLVPPSAAPVLEEVASRYAIAVTPALAALIDRADPDDPIARQFIPAGAELAQTPEEMDDPIGDLTHTPAPGVVRRYPDRALLMVTHSCAAYCRFCFRRERVGPGGGGTLAGEALETALAYIAGEPQIWEVILTGGDPLVLSARRLGAILDRLAQIEHVKIVRIHTRLPVVDPARIDEALVATLRRRSGQTTYVALHANHPRELTTEARAACARLVDAGIPMVSQTVLLRGVNDNPEVLGDLMRAFVEAGVKPYYLHLADLAPGTAHLRAPLEEAQALMRRLRGRLSGLAQPTLILDIPGGHGKVPVGPAYIEKTPGEGLTVEDPWGRRRPYPPRA